MRRTCGIQRIGCFMLQGVRERLFESWRLLTLGVLLALGAPLVSAQLPGQNPTMPGQRPNQLPPDADQPNAKPEHHHPMPSKDLREKLQKGLENKNAAYAGSNIKAVVDDQSVTLNGTVTSSMQKEMALQLARAYGDDRKIVDHLTIQ